MEVGERAKMSGKKGHARTQNEEGMKTCNNKREGGKGSAGMQSKVQSGGWQEGKKEE